MEAPSAVLTINRSATQERRIQRDGAIVITSQACNVLLCLLIAYFLTQQHLPLHLSYALLPLFAACVGIYAMYGQLRWRRLNRKMRNLQLVLAEHGVTYTSDAGTFSAPWSAVRRVRLQERRMSGTYLIVDALHWGGPIGKMGRVCRLVLPLDEDEIDMRRLKQTIHQLSGGSVLATRG